MRGWVRIVGACLGLPVTDLSRINSTRGPWGNSFKQLHFTSSYWAFLFQECGQDTRRYPSGAGHCRPSSQLHMPLSFVWKRVANPVVVTISGGDNVLITHHSSMGPTNNYCQSTAVYWTLREGVRRVWGGWSEIVLSPTGSLWKSLCMVRDRVAWIHSPPCKPQPPWVRAWAVSHSWAEASQDL